MFIKVENKILVEVVERLALEIWWEYFGPMFERETLEYMIEKLQSKDAILNQISEGYQYYLIQPKQDAVGYFAFRINDDTSEIVLSKLYLLSSERGKGLGKRVIQLLEEMVQRQKLKKIALTVFHKNSAAIRAYEKVGFIKTGPVYRDIGNGIIIYDYGMEKVV
jgi:ribosomal protein S18 acetylase RimI-like enzyme